MTVHIENYTYKAKSIYAKLIIYTELFIYALTDYQQDLAKYN